MIYLILEEFGHLLKGYLSTIIYIKVGEGLLEMFGADTILIIESRHQKLGIIDFSGVVHIDKLYYLLDHLIVNLLKFLTS